MSEELTKESIRKQEYEARRLYHNLQYELTKRYQRRPNAEEEAELVKLKAYADELRGKGIALFATPVVADCETCKEVSVFGGPSHYASRMCQSGARPHCTCSACF